MNEPHLRALEGGQGHAPIEDIRRGCLRNKSETLSDPDLRAEIEARSAQTHAKVRAAEAAMRRPGPAQRRGVRAAGNDEI